MNNIIFITGGAGYVGAMLLDILSRRSDVSKIIALDVQPFPDFLNTSGADVSKIKFIVANTADNTWQSEVAGYQPNVVIHTAWQIREMYGKKKLQWKWNVTGSDNIFDFAFTTPSVKKLIHFSTVASYGAFSTNTTDHFYKESEPFRQTNYLYAEEKRIVELHLEERYAKAKANGTQVKVAIIRPAAITGPRGRYMRIRFGLQSALSGALKTQKSYLYKLISLWVSWVPVTPKWLRQYVHEDDITAAVELLAFNDLKNQYDAFNVSPPGDCVFGADMAQAVGKRKLPIQPWMVRLAFFWVWHLTRGRIPTSKGSWKGYSYPIAVTGAKITNMYGFKYRWTSKEAFTTRDGIYSKYAK